MDIKELAPVFEDGFYKQPFNVDIDYRMLGRGSAGDGYCEYEWWEASRGWPAYYPAWDRGGWNAAHMVPGLDAYVMREAWARAQTHRCALRMIDDPALLRGWDAPGLSWFAYNIGLWFVPAYPMLIFIRMKTGCRDTYPDQDCRDWCSVLRVVYGAPTPIIDVIGPLPGRCDIPTLDRYADGDVDVQATWKRLRREIAWPWRMSGGRP